MWEGFQEAIKGGYSAMQNPSFRRDYVQFSVCMGVIVVVLHLLFFLLLALYAPLVFLLLAWAPALTAQAFSLIPLWAFVIVKKRYPMASNRLFLDELELLSPQRAKELEQQMNLDNSLNKFWMEDLYHDLRTSWHFTRASLIWLAFSIIPVFGSFITWIGQTWLVADRMGWNLLSAYTISAKKMSYRQQKHWMRARKWRIMGFTVPFVFLSSLPFIGPFFLGLAQAATAHIYFHLLSKEGETTRKPEEPVEFKKPT